MNYNEAGVRLLHITKMASDVPYVRGLKFTDDMSPIEESALGQEHCDIGKLAAGLYELHRRGIVVGDISMNTIGTIDRMDSYIQLTEKSYFADLSPSTDRQFFINDKTGVSNDIFSLGMMALCMFIYKNDATGQDFYLKFKDYPRNFLSHYPNEILQDSINVHYAEFKRVHPQYAAMINHRGRNFNLGEISFVHTFITLPRVPRRLNYIETNSIINQVFLQGKTDEVYTLVIAVDLARKLHFKLLLQILGVGANGAEIAGSFVLNLARSLKGKVSDPNVANFIKSEPSIKSLEQEQMLAQCNDGVIYRQAMNKLLESKIQICTLPDSYLMDYLNRFANARYARSNVVLVKPPAGYALDEA